MWKHAISKAGLYIGAFAFGYVGGHFNHRPPADIEIAPIVNAAPVGQGPTMNSPEFPKIIPPPALKMSRHESVVNAEEEPLSRADFETEVEVGLTDFDNPDEQIQSILTADLSAFSQEGEQFIENADPLETMYNLPSEHQLDYVKRLVNSQEDAAIVALNDLILHDNTAIQNAAIEGMLDLLEMRTGHYEVIEQNLEQNSFFLNEKQLDKLERIRRIASHP